MIIAIDGTAASGKGTLGRTLAMRLHFDYLDTRVQKDVEYQVKLNYPDTTTIIDNQDFKTTFKNAINTTGIVISIDDISIDNNNVVTFKVSTLGEDKHNENRNIIENSLNTSILILFLGLKVGLPVSFLDLWPPLIFYPCGFPTRQQL